MVTDYLEGAMAASRRARVERHLADCDGCAEYLREIRATIDVLGRIGPEDVRPEALEALTVVFRAVTSEIEEEDGSLER